jgi:hypothetical protein
MPLPDFCLPNGRYKPGYDPRAATGEHANSTVVKEEGSIKV